VAGASVLVSPEIGRHAALLAPPLLLGAVGFAVVGTLLSALALTTRLREVVLPILLLPIVLPVVIASGAAVAQVLAGARLASLGGPLRFLVAYDVLFLVLGAWLYEYAVEE
jgi:heme exporter protein B